MPSFLYLDIEFLQEYLKFILCRKAGINKESALRIPFLEPSVIKELMLLVYNERYDIMLQALEKPRKRHHRRRNENRCRREENYHAAERAVAP